MKKINVLLLFTLLPLIAFSQVKSPAEYLGYELGSKYTPHYKVMNYFMHVAEESDFVNASVYGKTYEGRELLIAILSSPDNLSDIEQIRQDNLKRAGMISGEPGNTKIPIVWLSYNVHGNETSSSEAAMNTLYKVISEHSDWLQNVIVIMDPMINPDGRDRYVNWFKSVVGTEVNPRPETREHREPWPGGRTNHYYFDLNRDWAWQTQIESRQRIKEYLKWMPHVHVDYHEQGYNSPYYFAPAAEPFHTAITDWQREFQTIIGKNHARYFDQNNWLYFTKEIFDLFYPSYGDTWPTFNGAIGMTYEQAGHSMGGRGVITVDGDTLTLKDRLTHHTVTGLSTIEITAQNKDKVVDEFQRYFKETIEEGSGDYKTYVIAESSNPDKKSRLVQYLRRQNIEVRRASENKRTEGFNYENGNSERVTVEKGDFIVSTKQPQGNLVRVLFEPKPELVDSLTYDITAWEIHYAFGVKGYALKGDVESESILAERVPSGMEGGQNMDMPAKVANAKPYAYIARWQSMEDMEFLGDLLESGIKVRYARESFTLNNNQFDAGTLIITQKGNEHLGEEFDELVRKSANKTGRRLYSAATGFVDEGKDFGSSSVRYIKKPNVAILSGDGTNSNMVGHMWHFFDQQIKYPVSMINLEDFGRVDWDDYHVILMPEAGYNSWGESDWNALKDWIRKGGTLIAFDGANRILSNQDGFNLKRKSNENEENTSEDPEDKLKIFGESARQNAQYMNAGSVFETTMDTTHPLAFGFKETYLSLKLGASAYEYMDNGWNVGVAKPGALRSGFVGNKAKANLEHTLTFGVQSMGAGDIVYLIDNPLFRGFWHNGKLLVGNAIFFVGN